MRVGRHTLNDATDLFFIVALNCTKTFLLAFVKFQIYTFYFKYKKYTLIQIKQTIKITKNRLIFKNI